MSIEDDLKPMLEHLGLEPWPDGRSIVDGKRPVEQHLMMIVASLLAERNKLRADLQKEHSDSLQHHHAWMAEMELRKAAEARINAMQPVVEAAVDLSVESLKAGRGIEAAMVVLLNKVKVYSEKQRPTRRDCGAPHPTGIGRCLLEVHHATDHANATSVWPNERRAAPTGAQKG